jgi:RND family efflux transporter MFP subunit
MELFAEAEPFVAGVTSRILVHVTLLPDFKPLESGQVSLTITSERDTIRKTVEKALGKGIYEFRMKPEYPGLAVMKAEIHTGKQNLTVKIPGVRIYSSVHEAEESRVTEEVSHVNAVVFTREQAWKTGFSVAFPVRKNLGDIVKTVARVDPTPLDEMLVSARMNGMVTLSGMSLTAGSPVYKGQRLCSVSADGLADNNITVRMREAQSNFSRAEADYTRLKRLAEERIISEKELLNAQNLYENSKVVYDQLMERFSVSGEHVDSPVAGFIGQLFARNGQFVEAGQPLMTVMKDQTLLLTAYIRYKKVPPPGSMVTATIRTSPGEKVYSLEELDGKIVSTGRSISGDHFLVPVTMRITNPGGILPGSLVEVWLKSTTSREALTIPVSALLEEQGAFFVYVQVAPELYEKREVKTGISDGLETEILSGISENERIVTKGAVLVRLSADTGVLDPHAGHVH